ncbi:hypothetical protein P0L94_13005 [Microbacter sp. GSS18]|nr:hypothetical protein P0L94_13005 [Microbacter sp. GSS18]
MRSWAAGAASAARTEPHDDERTTTTTGIDVFTVDVDGLIRNVTASWSDDDIVTSPAP